MASRSKDLTRPITTATRVRFVVSGPVFLHRPAFLQHAFSKHSDAAALTARAAVCAAIVTSMSGAVRYPLAILGGLVTVFAIDGVCYYVSMHALGRSFDHPTSGFLVGSLCYSYLSRTAGGFVAGDIVHRRTLVPGVVLAACLLLLGLYNVEKGFGVMGRSSLYVVLLNLVGPLFAILGAYLWSRTKPRTLARSR